MEHWTDRLSEYLDGGLSAAERRAADAHLAACETCARTLGELRAVSERARALESQAPEVDLWPAVAARLTPRPLPWWRRVAAGLDPGARRYIFSFPQLAAAALALVLITGGMAWLAFHRPAGEVAQAPAARPSRGAGAGPLAARPVPPPSAAPRPSQAPEPESTTQGALASFDATRYDAAVAELQRVLHEHRAELDTATVRILEQNLAIIDRATDEARRALAADPANPYLNGHLAEQMKIKIRLLQRAAEMVTAQS